MSCYRGLPKVPNPCKIPSGLQVDTAAELKSSAVVDFSGIPF